MKKVLLIALVASGLAFVPVQRSDAQVYVGVPGTGVGVGVGFGYPSYGYYGYPRYYSSYYGYYPYRTYYYGGPSYYWYNGHRYYFVLNFSHGGTTQKFSLPGLGTQTVEVAGEGRSVSASGGAITDSFGAYDIHVYRV